MLQGSQARGKQGGRGRGTQESLTFIALYLYTVYICNDLVLLTVLKFICGTARVHPLYPLLYGCQCVWVWVFFFFCRVEIVYNVNVYIVSFSLSLTHTDISELFRFV